MVTKRRILALVPLFITDEETANIKKFLSGYAWKGTSIDVVGLQRNIAVNSYSEAEAAAPEWMDLLVKAESDGYDAVISYCYADVGVDAAKEIVRIPVIGPMETSVIVANMLGNRFSLVTVGATYPPGEFINLPRLRILGLDSNYVSSRGIGFEKYFMFSEDGEAVATMRKALMDECWKALADGAHVLILGCSGFPFAKVLSDQLKVPIIDVPITLKMAEVLTDLRMNYRPSASNPNPVKGEFAEVASKMRIKLLVPFSGELDPDSLERLRKYVDEEADIAIALSENGPESIKSALDIVKAAPFIMREARDAEKEGYHAVVICSLADIGLESARELCNVPILGMGETSILLACMMGMKIAVIISDRKIQSYIEKIVRKLGLRDRVSSVVTLSKRCSELNVEELVTEIHRLVDNSVDAIILGDVNMFDRMQQIQSRVKVTILDPLASTIKMAEVLHRMKLAHSKFSHPKPALPNYHKKRLEKLEKKPEASLLLYDSSK